MHKNVLIQRDMHNGILPNHVSLKTNNRLEEKVQDFPK